MSQRQCLSDAAERHLLHHTKQPQQRHLIRHSQMMQRCMHPVGCPARHSVSNHNGNAAVWHAVPTCNLPRPAAPSTPCKGASSPLHARQLRPSRVIIATASWGKQPSSKQPPDDSAEALQQQQDEERPPVVPSSSEAASTSTSEPEQPQPAWLGAFGNARQFWRQAAQQEQQQPGQNGTQGSEQQQGLWHSLQALATGSHGVVTGASTLQPWTALVLLPIIVWCITWSLTGGLAVLASSCMGGMSGIARLLHPTLPWKGVDYEDVAIMLTKAMHTGSDAMWTRQGFWAPAWLLRGAMQQMYAAATASVMVASTLMRVPAWLGLMDVARALLYVSCFLLMLPTGSWLRNAYEAVKDRPKEQRLSSPNALLLKLAGLLTWPCITTAALSTYQQQQPALAPNFPTAAAQLLASSGSVILLLSVAAGAMWMAWMVLRRRAGSETVLAFGRGVGAVCALQGALNVLQLGVDAASGQLAPTESVAQLVSTLILGRIAWGVQQLQQQGQSSPAVWLEQLSFAPGGTQSNGEGSTPAKGAPP